MQQRAQSIGELLDLGTVEGSYFTDLVKGPASTSWSSKSFKTR
ncbi:hypothetical protein ACQPW1_26460 [Nocardia sp. CA-128927]